MHIRSDISVVSYIGYSKRLLAGIIFVFKLFSFYKIANWLNPGRNRDSCIYYCATVCSFTSISHSLK